MRKPSRESMPSSLCAPATLLGRAVSQYATHSRNALSLEASIRLQIDPERDRSPDSTILAPSPCTSPRTCLSLLPISALQISLRNQHRHLHHRHLLLYRRLDSLPSPISLPRLPLLQLKAIVVLVMVQAAILAPSFPKSLLRP